MRIQMAFERYDIVQSNKELTNLLKMFTFVFITAYKSFYNSYLLVDRWKDFSWKTLGQIPGRYTMMAHWSAQTCATSASSGSHSRGGRHARYTTEGFSQYDHAGRQRRTIVFQKWYTENCPPPCHPQTVPRFHQVILDLGPLHYVKIYARHVRVKAGSCNFQHNFKLAKSYM